ncbi:MAG: ABC transporter substrate-binding protein [Sedimentisphaerales bacterium]
MRSFWCVLLVLVVAGHSANADNKDPNDPNALSPTKSGLVVTDPNELTGLLQTRWNAIISILQNKDIDQKAKAKQIYKIVDPIFDFPLMAKLALGKKHWPKLTPPQREKFTQLFIDRLKSSYLDKAKLYTGEKALYKPIVRKRKNIIYVPVQLASGDKGIAIVYKLRKMNPPQVGWKIYDVEIQGVSILLTYWSQFDDILRHGTIDELLSRLEKPPER